MCIFCQEEGRPYCAHYTSECWVNKFSVAQKWEILARHKACLKCLDLGHEISSCPEKIRTCSNCRVTHGAQLPCRPEVSGSSGRGKNSNGNVKPKSSAPTGPVQNNTALYGGQPPFRPCYSRTCPVTFTHPSSRQSVVGLAIIDD